MKRHKYGMMIVFLLIFVSACSHSTQVSSFEGIMEKMIDYRNKTEIPASDYVESVTTIYENNEVVKKESMKKWYDYETGKERIETSPEGQPRQFSVFNGNERIVYIDGDSKAIILNPQNNAAAKPESMVDSIIQMLQQFSDTHHIDLEGEEEIEGVPTYYLKLKAKDQHAISGDKEIWIDQETWMLKRFMNVMGNERQETLYKRYEANPQHIAEKFTLELPAGVEKVEDQLQTKMVTLDDIKEFFSQSFYYFPGTKQIQMLFGEQAQDMMNISYAKEGLTYFTLSLKKVDENDVSITGEYKVRNHSAELKKENGLGYSLTWLEDGIQYWIHDFANVLSKEEILQIAEDMKKY
jgi:outer membrane lipoprotein-sorting protein